MSLPMWTAAPLSVVAGALVVLSYAPVGWWPLALAGVTLALWTCCGRSTGGALLVGVMFGATFYGAHLAWVSSFLGPLPWIALTGLQTALFAVGTVPLALADRWTRRWAPAALPQLLLAPSLMAGLWLARESIMDSWPYGGFPWARLAVSQANGPLTPLASWVGFDGLSFFLALWCACLLAWGRSLAYTARHQHWTWPRTRNRRGEHPQLQRPLTGTAQAGEPLRRPTWSRWSAVVPTGVVGLLLVAVPQYPTQPVGELRVGWVQGDGPAGYFDTRSPGDVLRAQLRASGQVLGQPMDLLVWPEGSVDLDPLHSLQTAAELDALTRAAGVPVLVNAATERAGTTYNTSILWTGRRGLLPGPLQLHDKSHPVPFGEYVPDRWLYETLVPDLVALLEREFTPGRNPPVVRAAGTTLGLVICFDVIYDDVPRRAVHDGAQVLVLQTNNADFRGTGQGSQQLAIARLRAIETGRAVVEVSTSGPSRVIAPDGSTIAGADAGVSAAQVTAVPLRAGLTAGVVTRGWLAVVVGLISSVLLVLCGVLARRGTRCTRGREP